MMREDDKLDRTIDAALSSYVSEPRMGLEERVLANVRAKSRSGRVHWLRWGAALGTAACILIAAALILRNTPYSNVVPRSPVLRQPAVREYHPPTQQARASSPRRKHVVRATSRPEPLPKLEQFPSPAPLSGDERALLAFAQQAKPETVKATVQTEKHETEPIDIPKLQIVELQIPPLSDGGN